MILHKICPICKSPSLKGYAIDCLKNGPHISRVFCSDCDIVFANPMADKNELSVFYKNYYHKGNYEQLGYTEMVLKKKREVDALSYEALRKEASFIYEYKTRGRFLDVGSGLGALLLYVDRPEFDLYVTEFDMDALTFIKSNYRNSVSTFYGDLIDANYPCEHFDYICCNHVIEHVLDPLAYMKEMYRILKKDGILFLGTPNRKSNLYILYRVAKLMTGSVPQIIDGIEHTFIFSMDNLLQLSRSVGFIPEKHRALTLGDSFKNIFQTNMTLRKKIVRYIQTWFRVNQELICKKTEKRV